MPDWSYQTILRPVLRRARPYGLLDAVGRSAVAGPLVAFMGDMDPGPDAAIPFGPRDLPAPVGLSCRMPGGGRLVALTSRFGVGFVELGPLRSAAEAETALAQLDRPRACSSPLAFRLEGPGAAAAFDVVARAAAFVTSSTADAALADRAKSADVPLLLASTDVETARSLGARGLWLEAAPGRTQLADLRSRWPQALLVVAGGIHEPGDAVAALDAGADAVAGDLGLLAAGPGFAKRVNEALRHRRQADGAAARRGVPPWLGLFAMAMVLLASGLAAWAVGVTRVLLAYDEAFLGMGRAELEAVNPRLLPFLAHDRVAFAATTVSTAVLLAALAYHGARRQERWARRAFAVSAIAGFAGFFLFLGFGYLDPLHLVVWVGALAGFLWGLRGTAEALPWVPAPDLRDDAAWRRGQWGQLLFVGLGFGLTVAGLSVCAVGVGPVFVATDLDFLGTTSTDLDAANPRLIALIAHDRAGFGQALTANGLAVLLLSVWGLRRGARWTWWTLTAAGVVGFAGVITIHADVGYMHLAHLAPAYLAFGVFAAACALSHGFLAGRPRQA